MKNNRRGLKNIIIISLIVLLIGGLGCTIYFANKNNSSLTHSNEKGMPTPQKMNNNGNTPPNMNSGNKDTPPAKPGEENKSDTSNEEKKDDTEEQVKNETENKETETTTKQENTNTNTNTNNNMPEMDNNRSETPSQNLTVYYILIGIESLILSLLVMYLIMSYFNKKTLKEVFVSNDKKLIYILSAIILTFSITFGSSFIINSNQKNNAPGMNSTNSNIKYSAKKVINSKKKESSKTIETTQEDQSAILVEDGGNLTLTDSTINKTSGDSSNTENSEFYGVNAGILVTEKSTATIKNTKITTNAKGSNAVFSTGENSKIYIGNSTIVTTGSSSSRGLDATYGGYIEAEKVSITTQGGSCATLATDRGEGTVKVSNSTLETNGSGSPVIYSTGNISIDKTKGVANSSQMVVIEGKNSATVTNSILEASGKGNRGNTDHAGIMIYQSMSGDAGEGTGTFTAKNSTLTIQEKSNYYKTAPMFFITNTDAVINLESTTLNYGSNTLISAKGTSEWGNSGSNGGKLVFNATKEELTGDIYVDNISTLTLNFTTSTYKGTINKDNTAKNIALKLDKDSKIVLTGDSYITSLEDDDSLYSNIDFNGYKLYVNGKSIS